MKTRILGAIVAILVLALLGVQHESSYQANRCQSCNNRSFPHMYLTFTPQRMPHILKVITQLLDVSKFEDETSITLLRRSQLLASSRK